MRHKHWIGTGAAIILGLIFLVAGMGKLLQAEALQAYFLTPFAEFLPPAFYKAVFLGLPLVELIVGLLLIIGIAVKLMAIFSLGLIGGFIINNGLLLWRGLGHKPCACFGAETPLRLLIVDSLRLDTVMLALVLIILFCDQSNFFNVYPRFLARKRENTMVSIDKVGTTSGNLGLKR